MPSRTRASRSCSRPATPRTAGWTRGRSPWRCRSRAPGAGSQRCATTAPWSPRSSTTKAWSGGRSWSRPGRRWPPSSSTTSVSPLRRRCRSASCAGPARGSRRAPSGNAAGSSATCTTAPSSGSSPSVSSSSSRRTSCVRTPERGADRLRELEHELDEALEDLRSLAHGVYPPLLADRGLVRRAAVGRDGIADPRRPRRAAARAATRPRWRAPSTSACSRRSRTCSSTPTARAASRVRVAGGPLGELHFSVRDDGAGTAGLAPAPGSRTCRIAWRRSAAR